MMIEENISLKPYNSFALVHKARFFGRFRSIEALQELISANTKKEKIILGGGSNILFVKDFDGLVLKNEIAGIEKIKEDDEFVYIRAGAGENWHSFVVYCIENNWSGVENLSLIPGCVGASPMQNIGAYGVELSEVFYELRAFHLLEKMNYTFGLKDCNFSYRDSVFKNKYRNQFAITHVTLRLSKIPKFNTSYGAIQAELEKMGIRELSIAAISQAVINIRKSKLPDPAIIGNAGSFFKNPSVSTEQFEELKNKFPAIIGHQNEDGTVKLAAGWMIEQCGPNDAVSWKGYRRGDAGCHEKQALVLVNFGNASGNEIFELSEEILYSVKNKFNIILEREVNII